MEKKMRLYYRWWFQMYLALNLFAKDVFSKYFCFIFQPEPCEMIQVGANDSDQTGRGNTYRISIIFWHQNSIKSPLFPISFHKVLCSASEGGTFGAFPT